MRYPLTAIASLCLATLSLGATESPAQPDQPFDGQLLLADRRNTGRTLYDRNQRTRQYQRQRGENYYQNYPRYGGENCASCGDYYYYSPSGDMTYYGLDMHPDAAGNEDR